MLQQRSRGLKRWATPTHTGQRKRRSVSCSQLFFCWQRMTRSESNLVHTNSIYLQSPRSVPPERRRETQRERDRGRWRGDGWEVKKKNIDDEENHPNWAFGFDLSDGFLLPLSRKSFCAWKLKTKTTIFGPRIILEIKMRLLQKLKFINTWIYSD